jgi:nitrile hydratase subunit beta
MNGAHDMGGRQGFGPVVTGGDEHVFHHGWEGRVYGLWDAVGAFDIMGSSEFRSAVENRSPRAYLASSYYELWLAVLEQQLLVKKMATAAELSSGVSGNGRVAEPLLHASEVLASHLTPSNDRRDIGSVAAYTVGETVRVHNRITFGHTRLPNYLRGCMGQITAIRGVYVYPDSSAHGRGEDPHWLYGVRFKAQDVWGKSSLDHVHADLWEPYLAAP